MKMLSKYQFTVIIVEARAKSGYNKISFQSKHLLFVFDPIALFILFGSTEFYRYNFSVFRDDFFRRLKRYKFTFFFPR